MRRSSGFTLIELVAAVVLLGFIGVFAGTLFSLGARGALASRQAEENGQKAKIAILRIAAELREINGGPASGGTAPRVTASEVAYTSSNAVLVGTTGSPRILAYDPTGKRITLTVGGVTQTLIDQVSSCVMSAQTTYSPTITISFTLLNSAGTFSITIAPRNSINTPAAS
jgi:prepilin-type N-terminal cleavage/methylation domain-containing protein